MSLTPDSDLAPSRGGKGAEPAAIERMIDAAVRCTLCGTKGIGNCECWVRCECGWLYEQGSKCRALLHALEGRGE